MLLSNNIKLKVNIVRYNSYSDKYVKESPEDVIDRNVAILSNELNTKVKIIPKVCFDVNASC